MNQIEPLYERTITLEQAMSMPYPFIPKDKFSAWMWFQIEIYEDKDEQGKFVREGIESLSYFPCPCPKTLSIVGDTHYFRPQHAIDYEVDAIGWHDLLEIDPSTDILQWGLKRGIAPFQPFQMFICVHYDCLYDGYSGGYECDVQYDNHVTKKEEISSSQCLANIEEALELLLHKE